LNGDAIALPSGEDGIDTAVTNTIACGIGKTIPVCQQPQGRQQRTHHVSKPIHHWFDAGKGKVFNVRARKGRLMDEDTGAMDCGGTRGASVLLRHCSGIALVLLPWVALR
jgi:hypothetical protein